MASRVEAIMQTLVTALTVPAMTSVPAASVFRDLDSAISSGFPAIVIEEGNEPAPDRRIITRAARELTVNMRILIKGSAPYALADAPLIEAYNRIMADTTMGGKAMNIVEGETTRERAVLEKPVAVVTKTFTVRYHTAGASLI